MNSHDRDSFVHRLRHDLEPILEMPDPRPKLSAYHDMPYAMFRYDPTDEYALRKEVTLLQTRLSQKGKRISRVSLASCLTDLMLRARSPEEWFDAEREQGTDVVVDTVHAVLAEDDALLELVMSRCPTDGDPRKDVVFITRAAALFPVFRCHILLEKMHGRLGLPAVLFYPGMLDGPVGLKFMGVIDPDPNYRPKIF